MAWFSSSAGPGCWVDAGGVLQASGDSTIGITGVGGISCVFLRCTLFRLYTVRQCLRRRTIFRQVFQRSLSSSRTCPQVGKALSSRGPLHATQEGRVKICRSSALVFCISCRCSVSCLVMEDLDSRRLRAVGRIVLVRRPSIRCAGLLSMP